MNRLIQVLGLVGAWVLSLGLGAVALAADTVDVTIEVIAPSRSGSFDAASKRYAPKIATFGYEGAKRIDTVTAKNRAEGSMVQLEFRDAKGRKQTIQVKVLSAGGAAPSFEISIPGYKFSTRTTHKNGGAFLAYIAEQKLFLAVRP